MDATQEGFTLIELLVVMIIIGILATIAIPVFLNQRAKAEDTAAKADVTTLGKEISSYYVEGATSLSLTGGAGANYVLTPVAGPAIDAGPSSARVLIDASTAIVDRDDWCVAVANPSGAQQVYSFSHDGGLDAGACP
ncbi:type IV pilin protein [Demequina maris]|uniref:type IV pilin protein n=1 Tax=Demequina maris TaxID=1638982 RepID=UPI001E57B25C|nr:type II secretion system protein [Demequina maris]